MTLALRTFVLVAVAVLATTPAVPAVDAAGMPLLAQASGVTLDKSKVRYGDASKFDATKAHKVGTLRSKDVYAQTPQRKEIDREGIKPGTARYNQLMKEATKSYKAAVKKVAKSKSLKLVVEEGGISGYDVTDVTSDVIAAL
jgi:hypothetical protein